MENVYYQLSINCLISVLYLLYVLSFQAAEIKKTATSESRDLSIPIKEVKDRNGTRRQLLTDQPLENTPNPGKTMSYFDTF